MTVRFLIAAALAASLAGCGAEQSATEPAPEEKASPMTNTDPFEQDRAVAPPAVEKRPVEITQHNETRVDDYGWLRVDNWQEVLRDPSALAEDVRNVLEAENAYYGAMTDDLEGLRKALFAEMRARVKENEASPPMLHGPWKYWYEYREGGEYRIYKRAPREGGEERILFDGDAESAGSTFFSIGGFSQSPDHRFAAYAVDRLGSEYYTIKVRDIESGADLGDVIENADSDGAIWAAGSNAFYYVERDDNQRPRRVKRHVLGSDPKSDAVVYEEPSDDFFLGVSKSQSGDYIFITSSNQITSEVRFLRADAQKPVATVIAPRAEGVEYYAEHHGDDFLIYTNADGAVNFKLMKAPVNAPAKDSWQAFLDHRADVHLTSFIPYKDFYVRLERSDALPRIVVSDYEGEEHTIAFDEAAYSIGLVAGFEFDTSTLRFTYESPATPEETFDYDMASRDRVLVKRQELPSGHDKDRYVVERFKAAAPDGAGVPVTVLRLKSTKLDGGAPVLLYGYGSYGVTIPASFSSNILPLVDRGVIYVVAHPRGGAALGRQWYLDGKLDKKMNTFTDFNAVADDLIRRGYTAERRIVIYGGSAGGLLVGAAINLRPELYAGVMAAVPFVDVINTISDGDLPLTPPEWEEWGNPITSAEEYGWIRAYSPYENIQNTQYPPIMATGGLTDYRVTYWEMAKWVARLRDDARGGPFLLRMNMGAGHGGSAARFERLDERAHLYAFALKSLGMADATPEAQDAP